MSYEPPYEIIHKIADYLGKPLPILKQDIIEHLRGLESHQQELAELSCKWQRMVREKENQMLHPKDANLTELDRKTMLNSSVAVLRQDHEYLKRLEELSKDRLEFGKLLLTYT